MDTYELNKKFIEAIKEKLPEKMSVAKAIMDTLFIGKEAVYRRLRGDVDFTFDEVVVLSRKFGISIDSVAGTMLPNNIVFELKPVSFSSDLKDIDYSMIEQFYDVLKLIKDDPRSEMVYSSNMFPQLIFTKYYNLSKLHTMKWLYQQEFVNKHNEPFHLIHYPQRLQQLKVDTYNQLKHVRNSTYIWDSMIFSSIVNDIKYFKSINLITEDEDIRNFKEELNMFLNELQELAVTGTFETGNKVNIYVSNTNIDSTYSYIIGKTYKISMIGVFAMNYITSLEERTLERMKAWAISQKKVSTLISESGELHRTRFFKQQREIINSL